MLNGHVPYQEKDLLTWARWYETFDKERIVAFDASMLGDVSTVFLSLEPLGQEKELIPALFQTLVTSGEFAGWLRNVSTWEEAEAQHRKVRQAVLEGRDPAEAFV